MINPRVYYFYNLSSEVSILTKLILNLKFSYNLIHTANRLLKFLMKNTHEEYKIVFERAFERSLMNKINLKEGDRSRQSFIDKIKLTSYSFFFVLCKISELIQQPFQILYCTPHLYFCHDKFNNYFIIKLYCKKIISSKSNIAKIKILETKS